MNINKNICNMNNLINIYMSLFIFNMINREFSIIDIRYILVIIGIPIILWRLKNIKNEYIKLNIINKLTILFCILFIGSNINWIFNGLNIGKDFFQYNILFIFNLITILICILYKEKIHINIVYKSILVSGIILFISMILILFNIDIMGGTYPGIVYGNEHINFLGLKFRLAGYAEDANYATIFMTIFLSTAIYFLKNNLVKYICVIIGMLGICLSASKTVAIGIFIALVCIILYKAKRWNIRRIYKYLVNLILLGVIIGPYIAIKIIDKINWESKLPTLDNRFLMWTHAIELFEKRPILGNGLTSFRTYFNNSMGDWYVQSHSTQFQILSEVGIIGLIVFALIFYYILKIKNSYVSFITITVLIFSTTTEINHLALLPFVIGILPIIGERYRDDKPIDKDKVLFLINSLGSGGAERVVANSANKLADMGKDVTVLIIKNIINYEFNNNVKIISLYEKVNEKKIKKILNIPINVLKINNIIDKLEEESRFGLITSHLPIMHITSRLLNIRERILFVIHNPHHHMDKNNSPIFKFLLRLQYNKMNVITVSKGVEEELTIKYGVRCNKIKTIYNPININNILNNIDEKLDFEYKYLLFCGRLTMQKRPDILIDAYYRGEFFKNYKLVLLGEGELLDSLKKQVKLLGIEDYVEFMGWQSNVYKWMKNCELMISTSDYEAFPMNLLEAFACSAKIVSMDCDFGPREILKDKYAKYLVPMNDMKKLIDTINLALDTYPDDRFEQIIEFDSNNINNQYLDTYIKWIN